MGVHHHGMGYGEIPVSETIFRHASVEIPTDSFLTLPQSLNLVLIFDNPALLQRKMNLLQKPKSLHDHKHSVLWFS